VRRIFNVLEAHLLALSGILFFRLFAFIGEWDG
jgi:hypothetical protein